MACCLRPGSAATAARPGSASRRPTRRLDAAGRLGSMPRRWPGCSARPMTGPRSPRPGSTSGSMPAGRSRGPLPPRAATGRPTRVHLKVDTGLGRAGAPPQRLAGPGRRRRQGGRPTAPSRWSGSGRTSPTPTARVIPRSSGTARLRRGARGRRGGRRRAAGAPPRQLRRDAGAARHPLRPGPSGHRGLRAVARARGRRARGARADPGDDADQPRSRWPSGCRPGTACPTATATRPRARPRSRWCRWDTPTVCRGT